MTLITAPDNAENFILGSLGIGMSPWRTYHVAAGMLEADESCVPPLEAAFRKILPAYLEARYSAFLYNDTSSVFFGPEIALTPSLRIGTPGSLSVGEDELVLIEALDQNTYDSMWERNAGVTVPFMVRARATIRMQATGARQALAWVLTGIGNVDEFHVLQFDQNLANRLSAASTNMVERLRKGNPPDPEDEDLDSALDLLESRESSTTDVGKDDPIITTIGEYEAKIAERLGLDRKSESLKKEEGTLKKAILRQLLQSPALRLPDKRIVTTKTIRKRPQTTQASSWQRLDIITPRP